MHMGRVGFVRKNKLQTKSKSKIVAFDFIHQTNDMIARVAVKHEL